MYFYMKYNYYYFFIQCGTIFFHGTSVSITFYIFEHYQLWMMHSKAQRAFFTKIPKLKSALVIIACLDD